MNESIDFDLKIDNDLAVFKLNEKRFDAAIAGMIKAEFSIVLSEDIKRFVIDMSQVEYCDSSGLSALLLAFRILQARDGEVKIANPQKSVKTLIEISQLNSILPYYNSVDEAINNFQKK